jgi:2-polyprenyl-6-methoxyphenol hydroxylase-like FAD-dependent oxidoreductase
MPSVPLWAGDPVVVVGNGPVGQTAALLLAHWGVPVLLLDARPRREAAGSRAVCQQRDVLDVWSALGAGSIAADGLTWTTARTFYREHELSAWSFADRGRSPLPPFVNISQAHTERVLDTCIAEHPLIEPRWNHEVLGLEQDPAGVAVRCVSPSGNELTMRASYVVLCAGSRADALRAGLGLSFDGRTFDDLFLICDIRARLPELNGERRFFFDPPWNPDRQVLIHPCPDSVFRIDWQVPPDFDLDAEERSGALEERIRRIVGEQDYELVWRSVYRFSSRCVDRMRVGRVLLAGDCAHVLAPFGARGLNSGVPDAENAAWKVAFVLHGWAPEALLDSYHGERHAAAAENLAVTAATMQFLVPSDAAQWQARRELLAAAVTDPAARERIDSGRFAEPFWYTDSPLTTPDPTRPFPGRPAKGEMPPVVPGVLLPDAPVRVTGRPEIKRVRELLRDGLTVLTTSGVDRIAVATAVARATAAPVQLFGVERIDADGALAAAMDTRPDEAWLIRPDGHVAAVLSDPQPAAVTAAIQRSLGAA